MKRSGPLRRRAWLKRSNPERKAKRYARDFGELADHVRTLPCAACNHPPPSDPAHVKSRGAGGHARLDSGDGNILPLCRICHREQHAQGWGAIFDGGRDDAELIARSVGESHPSENVELT